MFLKALPTALKFFFNAPLLLFSPDRRRPQPKGSFLPFRRLVGRHPPPQVDSALLRAKYEKKGAILFGWLKVSIAARSKQNEVNSSIYKHTTVCTVYYDVDCLYENEYMVSLDLLKSKSLFIRPDLPFISLVQYIHNGISDTFQTYST